VENTTYDIVVIGKGLMGAATAPQLSGMQSRVTLLGLDEPTDRATLAGSFSSHYNEGRGSVLVGGNSSSVKPPHEIGRLGALMIARDNWAYDQEAHHFSAQCALAS
jgi:choline dehydrogenase-like flavoprotein